MEAARVWVRSIAVLVMVAAFLDFLMPQGSLRRFARVVMGLFVLLAILQPVVTLMHQEIAVTRALLTGADQLPAFGHPGGGAGQGTGAGTGTVAGGGAGGGAGSGTASGGGTKAGAGSDAALTSQTLALTEKALARQVEGIVRSVTGISGATAEVKLSAGDGTTPGGVGHVRIVLPAQGKGAAGGGSAGGGATGTPPVTIAIPPILPGTTAPSAITAAKDRQAEANRIKEVLSDLYVMPPENIEVVTP